MTEQTVIRSWHDQPWIMTLKLEWIETTLGLTRGRDDIAFHADNRTSDFRERAKLYDTLCVGGVKKEGERMPLWAASCDDAVEGFLGSLGDYLRARPGHTVINWRKAPEIVTYGDGKWQCVARLYCDTPEAG